ncbi:MAG: adenylate/guanylate cyclase domain-containing protein [Spirochaetales bacterium]|nr:adenylate/guanylate cyclase domain-containing protein [Spirochaetales bacterium]
MGKAPKTEKGSGLLGMSGKILSGKEEGKADSKTVVADIVGYINDLLEHNGKGKDSKELTNILTLIRNYNEGISGGVSNSFGNNTGETSTALEKASLEISIRREIEEFYLPKHLVEAIVEKGAIPTESEQCIVGIGFIDIADYSFLSKFLTPMENQIVLNGLYASFNWVLQQHGGYLNKIEGDSLMFHYGGNIDPKIRDLDLDEAEKYIAQELFYTCIHMQRVAFLFNDANDSFLYGSDNPDTRKQVDDAYRIIRTMRTSELAKTINAFFQIRIRIGANIGEVTIGNFGPEGGKQWDIIGVPVIIAKRMESTAPIGGFRISEELYTILKETGLTEAYFHRFKREAEAMFGSFSTITREELFKFGQVTLKDKKDVQFNTYSIQVNPALPEALMNQVELLVNRDQMGAQRIVQLLQYYRGNKFVINAIEATLISKDVVIRKTDIFNYIFPLRYKELLSEYKDDKERADRFISGKYNLFELFEMMGHLQDVIKSDMILKDKPNIIFEDYDSYIKETDEWIRKENDHKEKRVYQRNYFHNYIYPMVFKSITASIIEFQHLEGELSEV